jgi:hypothetical protein
VTNTEDDMKTKLILQAATTFLVLSLGSGLLPAGMGAAATEPAQPQGGTLP